MSEIHRLSKLEKNVKDEWPPEKKLDVVLAGLRGDCSVSELCRQAGISTSRYYQWRDQVIKAARYGLLHSETEHQEMRERIHQLEAENASLRTRVNIFQDVCLAD